MTSRAALSPLEDAEAAITVDQAARLLGCDPSTVRKMLRRRQLTGHRVGAGDQPSGIRVDLASVRAYKQRHAINSTPDAPKPSRGGRSAPRGQGAAYTDALAYLKAAGVRF